MDNNSVKKTLIVASVLCIFFSVLVSVAAVGLKPLQEKNRELDVKKNILKAAGVDVEGEDAIENAFSQVTTLYIELPSGEIKDIKPSDKNLLKEAVSIDPTKDVGHLNIRAKYIPVYLLKEDGLLKTMVLPVVSKGLWSTMYAFIALDKDLNTIKGLEYYIQGETPGLGAEVTNPKWKSQWDGKKLYKGPEVALEITKAGMAKDKLHDVDGISGATITSHGVGNSLKYWFGEDGFQNFLAEIERQRAEGKL